MFDHLSQGRFIMGVSAGALTSDAEALGILDEDRNKMFAEAIDVILAIWERDPPYDIDFPDNRLQGLDQPHQGARARRRLSWRSRSRSRGRRSSAPWWRRSRPAWC